MNIQTRKQALRQSIIAARSNIAESKREEFSGKISVQIAELASYHKATTVMAYMNFGEEFVAEIFVRQALTDGKQVLLPKVNRDTKQLDVYRLADLVQDVAPGMWGIREPRIEQCEKIDDLSIIDFILLPGVAFTCEGDRLGYGGGFYDKLLERISHHPTLVAGAFSMQVVAEIPQESTDRKVDWLITENETIRCNLGES